MDIDRNTGLMLAGLLLSVVYLMKTRESYDNAIPYTLLADSDNSAIPETDKASRDEETKYLDTRKQNNLAFSDGTTLLPDEKSPFAADLTKINFLSAGQYVGIDTRPQTKVHNLDIRPFPVIPRSSTDNPWFNETPYEADLPKKRIS